MQLFSYLIVLQIIFVISGAQSVYTNYGAQTTAADNNTDTKDQHEAVHLDETVRMTVFYETLCPYSMKFFTEQISKLFHNDTKLYKYVRFDFVPYGNAKQEYSKKGWKFTCQHGPTECKYNMLHACVVKTVSLANGVNEDIERFVPFLICLMSTKQEHTVITQCAEKYDIPADGIRHCLTRGNGEKLLAKYGNRTHEFKPPIKSVPTIVFNGVYKEDNQKLAETNLPQAICSNLKPKPKICNTTKIYSVTVTIV
ncbi:gamma-interferon-inducible lysosomal thiol reductase-like protein [Lycorma delicatula]|uniref:gamma-interferon-inducible lysosomal thiol reductase-like protein n=1 Tax=Lycorma delicatula TaxID=130591 RepID=UPI003F518AE1